MGVVKEGNSTGIRGCFSERDRHTQADAGKTRKYRPSQDLEQGCLGQWNK